jgi:hypothetical protein
MAALEEHMLAAYDEPDIDDEQTREDYRVGGDREATWCFRKIAQAERECARIVELAAAERDRIDDWEAAAVGPHHKTIEFFTSKLIQYRRALEADDPKLPGTYKVPGGAITRRKGRDRVEITDETAFVVWALDTDPEAIKVTPLKSRLTAKEAPYVVRGGDELRFVDPSTGEYVAGAVLVRGEPSYDVKLDSDPGGAP